MPEKRRLPTCQKKKVDYFVDGVEYRIIFLHVRIEVAFFPGGLAEMASVLLQVLERTEINKLPKGVQNKLEKIVTELQNANESLKAQHERFRADTGG